MALPVWKMLNEGRQVEISTAEGAEKEGRTLAAGSWTEWAAALLPIFRSIYNQYDGSFMAYKKSLLHGTACKMRHKCFYLR